MVSGHAPAAPHTSWGPRAGGADPLSLPIMTALWSCSFQGLQLHRRIATSVCLPSSVRTWAGAKGLMCSGKPALVDASCSFFSAEKLPGFHLCCPGTFPKGSPSPFLGKSLLPVPALLCGSSSLFRKSITMLYTEELRVCFFRHNIFKQLQSCSLQQTVQPLAA